MAIRPTVLYDAPGPKARRRNRIYSALTITVLVLACYWVITLLADAGQLEAEKWEPFIHADIWRTYLLPGLAGTLQAAFFSIIFAVVVGTLLGIGRLSPNPISRWFCAIIVEFFRAIPVLLLIIFSYQVVAMYGLVPPRQLALTAVVFALTMYNGSVIAEILRSGMKSLPKGQTEAAMALGLSHRQTQWQILLPQAAAAMLPALIAQAVIALKDSALGYQIGFIEIVRQGIQSSSVYRNYLPALIVVAAIMITINYLLGLLAERTERQLRAGRARRNIFAKVPEQPTQGLDTKDNANVDWHEKSHKEIKNPAQ